MAITTRARVALLVAVSALAVAGFAGARDVAASSRESAGGGSGPAAGGGVAGMCASPEPGAPVTACDDTVEEPVTDPGACGEQVTGTGPDAAVSFTACPGDDQSRVHDVGDGAQLVEPTPGMAGVRPRMFDEAVVAGDGSSVTVSFWSGVEPCHVLDHVDVAYGTDAITITLFEGHDASAGDVACIEIALLKKVVVPLDVPVGDRGIVDGAA